MFQELDASETERRRQRNRIHFELAVPADLAQARLATTVAAGGRLLDQSEGRWRAVGAPTLRLGLPRGHYGQFRSTIRVCGDPSLGQTSRR